MQLEKYFKDKRVFITGHTGFKGAWLVTWLEMMGAKVKGYALAPENKDSLYLGINGDELCDSVIADIRDKEKLSQEIISFKPDFVFHLAAQALVRDSYHIPVETFHVNAIGTANLLDALRYLDAPCVAVIITTDKVYQNLEKDYYYKEDDRLGGYDPYSASKACAELVTESYRNSFFNTKDFQQHQKTISVARAGNVIGGGDWAKDRIIPDIIRALVSNNAITLRNPGAVRPWQHVLECLYGYLVLAASQTENPQERSVAYNFGPVPNDNLMVKQVTEEAIRIWGQGVYQEQKNEAAPHEANLLQLNIQKATTELPWKPRMNARQAIEKTINWYKQALKDPGSVRTITRADISAYLSI